MNDDSKPRTIPKPRIILMVAIDIIAIAAALGLYLFLQPRDASAAFLAAASCLVFGAFFNLVIALVSLKP